MDKGKCWSCFEAASGEWRNNVVKSFAAVTRTLSPPRPASRLANEEREIQEASQKSRLKRSKQAANTQKRHQEYAEAMFNSDARIKIKVSPKDLRGLQKRALAEGIPYQADRQHSAQVRRGPAMREQRPTWRSSRHRLLRGFLRKSSALFRRKLLHVRRS